MSEECSYCGEKLDDSFLYENYVESDQEEFTILCPECDKELKIIAYVNIDFTIEKGGSG